MTQQSSTVVLEDDAVEIEGAVDWLTITCRSHTSRVRLYYSAMAMFELAKKLGEEPVKWRFKGYAGLKSFGFRWGTRQDSDIAMLSGLDAKTAWFTFAHLAENVTRLDLAVTVLLAEPQPELAVQAYRHVMREREKGKMDNRTYTIIKNSKGGQTCYVGSRMSDQYGRLYDKARENDLEQLHDRLWRYEVEFKARRAKAVLSQLVKRSQTGDVAEDIIHTVGLWFYCRHVPIAFENQKHKALSTEIEGRVTSDEISLQWLSTQVRPTVARLIKRGKIEKVFYALKLMEPIR